MKHESKASHLKNVMLWLIERRLRSIDYPWIKAWTIPCNSCMLYGGMYTIVRGCKKLIACSNVQGLTGLLTIVFGNTVQHCSYKYKVVRTMLRTIKTSSSDSNT